MSRYQSEIRELMLIDKYPPPKNGKVLDLCCGSGMYRKYFENQKYFGVDKFDNNFAAKEEENVRFIIEDAENLSFEDEFFDYVFCSAGLEHVRNKDKVAKELARVMKVGTYAYVSAPSKVSLIYSLPRYIFCKISGQTFYGHGHHYYSKSDLSSLMKLNGLEVVDSYPETGFFALLWITAGKWSSTTLSICSGIYNKLTKNEKKTSKEKIKDVDSNSAENSQPADFDPRDDHDVKIDYTINNKEVEKIKLNKKYGPTGIFFTKLFWALDYYFPIPIVAGWILIVRKK